MSSPIVELAKLFKERDNTSGYSPMFGTIVSLPNVQIRIGDRIVLDSSHLSSCVDLTATDIHGQYIHLGKTVVLLPYSGQQKFIVIGVIL